MFQDYYPVVVQALAGENYTVYAYFTDGSVHLFDMKSLIASGGVFENLNDYDFFLNRLTVMNDTIAWRLGDDFNPANCIDIDPFTVYNSISVNDPLEQLAS